MKNALSGNEEFTFSGTPLDMNILEFWQWHFSDVYDLQEKIAEFIVARALGCKEPDNTGSWTLYDISYRGLRLEVKETSYYHSWQSDEEAKSKQRPFGISKAYSVYKDPTSEFARQNDVYIFCLNTGETRETSNPLQLEHWEFYVVPTSVINEECGDGKTISLTRVQKLTEKVDYASLKARVDEVIDRMKKCKKRH